MPDIKLPKGFKLDEEVKLPKGFTLDEKKNEVQPALPTGTQPSKRGFEPFLPQVPTKAPSVLLSDEQKQQREKERIGERFETTLLNVPTEFGKVDQFMRSAKKVQDTLPQVPTIKPSTGGMVVIPQGEKIGDSLRKGDTLQDELTDKFTNKKTALQKQIESAQEAFRTAQGEDVYGEIQDAQQLDYISPERVEVEREREGNYVKFLYNQFLDGTGSAVSGIVDAALAIDKGMPMASPLAKSGLILDYYRKNYAKGVKNFLKDNIGAEVDKGLEAKYNEGMLTGAIGGLASSAPAMLTGGMTKGLSMVAQMYDGAIQSIESRPDADQWDNDTKTLFAGTLGLIQGQLEKYGLDKVLKGGELTNVIFKKILKSAEGKNITGNVLENLIDESVKGVARVFAKGGVRAVDGFASEFYTGAGQEASAIGIESLFDKVTGKPIFDTSNKANWIGFVDRIAKAGFQEGIGGFVLGGGAGMLSGASKKKVKENQTVINEIDKQLENTDTLPEVKEILIQRKADSQANIDDIVDEEADKQSKMSSEDFAKSQELSKQVEKIDLALQDPNTGESVKAGLESQKKAIESEIDEILKKVPAIAKPTFDTEELLIEEGRKAEAEFKQTDDLVTYDQKMKELEDRANNLVPAPEDAEIEDIGKSYPSPAIVVKKFNPEEANELLTGEDYDYQLKRIERTIASGIKAGETAKQIRERLGANGHVFNFGSDSETVVNYIKKRIDGTENRPFQDFAKNTRNKPTSKDADIVEPSQEQKLKDIQDGNVVTFTYSSESEVPDVLKDKISSVSETNGVKEIRVTLPKSEADYLLKPQEDAVQVETAGQVPVQPEAPVGEEVEQGKPEAKPKVVTEEGVKAEEVKPIDEIEKPKSIRLNMSEEGLAKMEGLKAKDVYPTRQFFKNKSINVGLPDVGSPQFDPFISENKDNTKEEIVDLSEITPTQELVDKSGIGGKLTIGNPKIVRFNDGLFVLDGHHRISTKAFRGNTKIKADVITIDKTSEEYSQDETNKSLIKYYREQEQAELKAAIPNADQYLTDGKVDKDKLTNDKDREAFSEIYDKYDKLITPLLSKKEAPAPKQEAPAKAEPKLKPRVETRIKFAKAIELFNDISATKGGAKKRTLSAKRKLFLEQNPSIKYIDDNWKKISKQLEDKGLLKKEGNCP
jgi:hypothetical protein